MATQYLNENYLFEQRHCTSLANLALIFYIPLKLENKWPNRQKP